MIIRKATPEDNRALLELARQAPMDAKLVVNIDRSPDIPFLNISVDLQGQFTNCPYSLLIIIHLELYQNICKIRRNGNFRG
ncbi:MAG: hypothetical protein KAU06_07205, partial [Candidatus Marinimicrobia bacterium]|nr:hypothetical protein [Candidatus Neomarinimicrobiota bacterium]